LYINHNSNHPPPIPHSIPDVMNKRLSNISSDKQSFESAAPPYQEALRKIGFNYVLNYNPQAPKPKRYRNVIWFNPPYSTAPTLPPTLVTNFCRLLMNASHPTNHPLHKLFNRNNLKLSYSCVPNVHNIPIGSVIAVRKNPAPSLANV
jgi:hypothetical protein